MSKAKGKSYQWVLPNVVDPPKTICFQIDVPDDPQHIAAFLGSIFDLSKPYHWANDDAHTAIAVGAVWKRIFLALRRNNCKYPNSPSIGTDGDDLMIRQNPDNPCLLESSIDGQTWCAFADISLCLPTTGQQGGGAPQPPFGGCQTYHASMSSKDKYLVPTLVSSGDTLELTNFGGGWNDGTLLDWFCPDGTNFTLGICVPGTFTLDAGDPLPTDPHMSLIMEIDGVFYPSGGILTVPAGVLNAQVTIQANDSSLNDNNGSISFDVAVCNNTAPAGAHIEAAGVFNGTITQTGNHVHLVSGPDVPDNVQLIDVQSIGQVNFNIANFVPSQSASYSEYYNHTGDPHINVGVVSPCYRFKWAIPGSGSAPFTIDFDIF
jgi:hypothetical protein